MPPLLELLLLLLPMGGLLVFILWDRHRLQSRRVDPLPRQRMAKGFTPSGLVMWQARFVFGLVCVAMTAVEWQRPSRPPFSGRWAWFNRAVYDNLGPSGLMWVWLLAAACLVASAWPSIRRR